MHRKGTEVASPWKRIAWFVAIWLCSVCALGLVAMAMRLLMRLAGLSPH